ncbi:hypothetical protein ABS768_06310 [Flavobacterium sp. ST-75]|uniref:Uncharacterized protein n=1 Tax=Flavobacterium rhizophilum TaxID=3163296 RepID=A0ABW8YCX8_9FLAO
MRKINKKIIVEFTKGDVLYGRKNSDAFHPILFLENKDENFFVGVMLTKSSGYGNIKLLEEHVVKYSLEGEKYSFEYNNTHFVKAKLLKRNEWSPFTKVGQINKEGLSFVEKNIMVDKAILWEEYLEGKK